MQINKSETINIAEDNRSSFITAVCECFSKIFAASLKSLG